QRERSERLDHRVAGRSSAWASTADRHPLPLMWMTADRPIDRAAGGARLAEHDRKIGLLHPPIVERACERRVRARGARDDENARRLLVEPVNDARTIVILLRGDEPSMEERVDDRAAPRPGSRMDDDAGRLVDRDELLVLIENP